MEDLINNSYSIMIFKPDECSKELSSLSVILNDTPIK